MSNDDRPSASRLLCLQLNMCLTWSHNGCDNNRRRMLYLLRCGGCAEAEARCMSIGEAARSPLSHNSDNGGGDGRNWLKVFLALAQVCSSNSIRPKHVDLSRFSLTGLETCRLADLRKTRRFDEILRTLHADVWQNLTTSAGQTTVFDFWKHATRIH